jgi:hypothetical protein
MKGSHLFWFGRSKHNGRLISGTSQRWRSRDSISGIGSEKRKWNLGVTSGFFTLGKSEGGTGSVPRGLLEAATRSYPVLPQEVNRKWHHFWYLPKEKNRKWTPGVKST